MTIQQALYPRPRGRDPEQLRQSIVALCDVLERRDRSSTAVQNLEALQASLTALQTELNALEDTVADLEVSGGSGLTAQQLFELSLVTAVSDVIGSVSEGVLKTLIQAQKAAEATIQALVKARRNEVKILVEQQTRLTETEALASQITTVAANLEAAQSSLTEEITARSTADSALASLVTTLTSAVNGNVAQIQVIAETINGVETRFGVALNENNQVVGLLQLDGTAIGTTFTLVADKVFIAQPSQTGGEPVPVFTIANVNGTPKLALRGDMLVDGDVLARHLAANAVTADKIAANAITAAKIAAGAITADKINAGSIFANRIRSPGGELDINPTASTPYIRLTT